MEVTHYLLLGTEAGIELITVDSHLQGQTCKLYSASQEVYL